MSQKKRRNRGLRVEILENRSLMAGDLGMGMVSGPSKYTDTDVAANVRGLTIGSNLSGLDINGQALQPSLFGGMITSQASASGKNFRIEVDSSDKLIGPASKKTDELQIWKLGDKVAEYLQNNLGKRVGNGECSSMVNVALAQAGVR